MGQAYGLDVKMHRSGDGSCSHHTAGQQATDALLESLRDRFARDT